MEFGFIGFINVFTNVLAGLNVDLNKSGKRGKTMVYADFTGYSVDSEGE